MDFDIAELLKVLIARGETLGYADDDYRATLEYIERHGHDKEDKATSIRRALATHTAEFEAERLILRTTELILSMMNDEGVTRKELAQRIGKSKGHVSQLLNGERNMTLRTLAEMAHALGYAIGVFGQNVED